MHLAAMMTIGMLTASAISFPRDLGAQSPSGIERPSLKVYLLGRHENPRACLDQAFQLGFAVPDPALLVEPSPALRSMLRDVAAEIAGLWDNCGPRAPGISRITAIGTHEGIVLRKMILTRANGWGAVAESSYVTTPSTAAPPASPTSISLGLLGFKNGTPLFEDNDRAYYLTDFRKGDDALIAVIHGGTEATPMLSFTLDNPLQLGFELSRQEIELFNQGVVPRLPSAVQQASRLVTAHYSAASRAQRFIPISNTTSAEWHLPASTIAESAPPDHVELPVFVISWLGTNGQFTPTPVLRYPPQIQNPKPDRALLNSGAAFAGSLSTPPPLRREHWDLMGFTSKPGAAVAVRPAVAAYRAGENRKREAALKGRYIYKNDAFWSRAPSSQLKGLFDGSSSAEQNSPLVRLSVYTYANLWSARCASRYQPTDAIFRRTRTMVTFNGYGAELSRSAPVVVGETRVERRFAAAYGRIVNASGVEAMSAEDRRELAVGTLRAVRALFSSPEALAEQVQWMRTFAGRVTESMTWLFDSFGCDSPVIAQMAENLHRYVSKRPTVQQSGFAIAGAQAQTDPVLEFGSATTLTQGCGEVQQVPFAEETYCRCVERALRGYLDQASYQRYARRFADLYAVTATMPPISSPMYPIYERVASCRR